MKTHTKLSLAVLVLSVVRRRWASNLCAVGDEAGTVWRRWARPDDGHRRCAGTGRCVAARGREPLPKGGPSRAAAARSTQTRQ